MKKIQFGTTALAAAIFVSSCSSSYQAQGGLAGAAIGGRVGETIGFLSGHGPFRGNSAALGGLVGMGVGAILGVSVASHIEKNEQQRYSENTASSRDKHKHSHSNSYDNRPQGVPDYQTGGGDYQTGGGNYGNPSETVSTSPIRISDLSYMDANGDGYISKGETCEIECFITNTTSEPLRDLVIYLGIDNSKRFSISPSLTTTLLPNQQIRFTGRVYCMKARSGQDVAVNLFVKDGDNINSSNDLFIRQK